MSPSEPADSLSLRLELGSGMRVQRLLEGLALVAAILTSDVRLVAVVLGILIAQVISPRLAFVAVLVAWVRSVPEKRRVSDMYHDLQGIRGSSAVAALMLTLGLILLARGHQVGWVLVAFPTASCLLAPTVGFCAGCSCYVVGRELAKRATKKEPHVEGASDVVLEPNPPPHP